MQRKYRARLAGIFIVLTFSGCGGSDEDEFSLVGTNTSVAEIAGNWSATRADFSRNTAGPGLKISVVDSGGTATLQIQGNGRFTFTIMLPGANTDISTGRLGFDEDLLVVGYDDDPEEFDFFGIQSTMNTMSIEGPTEFDFDGDGVDEPARVTLDLVRN